jgi:antitoxin VapB
MTLSIRDLETERLAAEVAAMTGDSKTGAVRQALRERRERLRAEERVGQAPPGSAAGAWLVIPPGEPARRYAIRW